MISIKNEESFIINNESSLKALNLNILVINSFDKFCNDLMNNLSLKKYNVKVASSFNEIEHIFSQYSFDYILIPIKFINYHYTLFVINLHYPIINNKKTKYYIFEFLKNDIKNLIMKNTDFSLYITNLHSIQKNKHNIEKVVNFDYNGDFLKYPKISKKNLFIKIPFFNDEFLLKVIEIIKL